MSDNKHYAPELRVDYDETEDPGFRKVAEVTRKKQVAGQWVPDASKPKKPVAKVLNHTHAIFQFRDAYKDNAGAYPVYNGSPFCVWKLVLGTYDADAGMFTPTAGEVSFIDNSKGRWVTDRIKRLIEENAGPDDVRSHVFVIGKRPGRGPQPSWFVDYVGKASTFPLPDSTARPSVIPAQAPEDADEEEDEIHGEGAPRLTRLEAEVIARLGESLAARKLTLTEYARQKGKTPEEVIVDLFTSGMARSDDDEPIQLDAQRARLIAQHARSLGIPL